MKEIIIKILALMVFYDFLLHLIEIKFGNRTKAMPKWYYWPPTKIFKNQSDIFYNYFWTVYWGTACVLLVYLVLG